MKYVELVYKERFIYNEENDCYYENDDLYIVLGNRIRKITKDTTNEEIIALIKEIITW